MIWSFTSCTRISMVLIAGTQRHIIRLQPLASDHTRTTGLKKEANRLPRVFQCVGVLLQKAYWRHQEIGQHWSHSTQCRQFWRRSHEHKGTQPNQEFSAYPLHAFGMSRRRTSKREMIVAGSNQTARRKEPQKKKKYSRTIESASWCESQKRGVPNTVCWCVQIDKDLPVSMYKVDGDSRPNSHIYIYMSSSENHTNGTQRESR